MKKQKKKMKKFDFEVLGMGTARGTYDGEFTPVVERLIKFWLNKYPGKTLHLFSGNSQIGDVRIDIDNPNATLQMDVEVYLAQSQDDFEWVLLDPPYLVESHDLKGYKISKAFSADVPARRLFQEWAQKHTKRIMWLDLCAPLPAGFEREKLYFLLPGGYRNIRVLSILRNEKTK